MIHYLDSSALVKRYVAEPGSREVAALFKGRGELAASRLALVEIGSALARRARDGDLDEHEAARLADQLREDVQDLRLVEVRPVVVDLAFDLVSRRALRAYAALQLASALRLKSASGLAISFWCADRELTAAARAEGLRTKQA